MENWKVALIGGSAGVGTVLFLKKKWTAGIILAGVGLATLASEYPEKFEAVWENAPDYLHKGVQIFNTLQKLGEGFAEEAERRSVGAWRSVTSEFGA